MLFIDLLLLTPQECTLKVQDGKFKLQDLLVVPMQRVLKYHLLLKVSHRRGRARAWRPPGLWGGAHRQAGLRQKQQTTQDSLCLAHKNCTAYTGNCSVHMYVRSVYQ